MALAIKNFGRETKDAGGSVEAFVETLSDGKTTLDSWTKKQKDSASDTEIVTKWQKMYNDELIKTYGLQTSLTDDFLAYRDEDIDRAGLDRTKGRNDAVMFDDRAYDASRDNLDAFHDDAKDIVNDIEHRNRAMAQSLSNDLIGAWKSSFEGGSFEMDKFFDNLANRIIENLIYSAISAIIEAIIDYYSGGSGGSWFGDIYDALTEKQSGGAVTKDQPYIVGEAGAELFIPNQSGYIVPNNEVNNYTGNTTTINLTFHGITDRKFVKETIIPEIKRVTGSQTI